MRGVIPEALASCKVVCCETNTEGSRTAKSGTDEQERYTEAMKMRISKHNIATSIFFHFIVDTAGIGKRKMLLPGEVSVTTCSITEKSAEVVVIMETSCEQKPQKPHEVMKD